MRVRLEGRTSRLLYFFVDHRKRIGGERVGVMLVVCTIDRQYC